MELEKLDRQEHKSCYQIARAPTFHLHSKSLDRNNLKAYNLKLSPQALSLTQILIFRSHTSPLMLSHLHLLVLPIYGYLIVAREEKYEEEIKQLKSDQTHPLMLPANAVTDAASRFEADAALLELTPK